MSRRLNLEGHRYGRLTVVSFERSVGRNTYWRCRCDCGEVAVASRNNLRSSNTSSCGCLADENRRALRRTHGMSQTATFKAWLTMRDRCYNEKHPYYFNYGGRGIRVCEAWRVSFENFYCDVGERPSKGYTLERIDNDKDYKPGNVKWATRYEQSRNKRNNVWLTLNGETLCLTDWARRLGFNRLTLASRIKRGWSVEDALTVPKRAW